MNLSDISGQYVVRTNGRFAKDINLFDISQDGLSINDQKIVDFSFAKGKLIWRGGNKECFSGQVTFLLDPIIKSIELFGEAKSQEEAGTFKCYGSAIYDQENLQYFGPEIPKWAEEYLISVVKLNSKNGGLLLWHKWEKYNYTNMIVNNVICKLG